MALTKTTLSSLRSTGDRRAAVLLVVGDASYPTGGWALTPADFGLGVIDWVEPTVQIAPAAAATVQYDKTNSKLKAFTSAGVEVANAVSLVLLTVQVTAYGTT